MKTEMKTVYVYAKYQRGNVSLEVSSDESDSTYCYDYLDIVSKPITTMEIAVPSLSEDELNKILSGAMLESLLAEKEKLQAETHRKLMQIDEKIGQLQALENKNA